MQSIRRLRIKFIRKLGRARSRVALNIVKKRDIIADYSDPGSQVWFGFPAASTDFRHDCFVTGVCEPDEIRKEGG